MSDIKEEQKRLYKRAKKNDKMHKIDDIPLVIDDEKIKEIYGGDYKKALVEVGKNERKYILKYKLLQDRINKALELLNDWNYLDKIDCYYEPKEVIDILKGDNK